MPKEEQHLHKYAYCYFPECQNYNALTSQNGRKYTYVTTKLHCVDTTGPGWFRFQDHTGTKMPTSCVPINRCNTHSPGWLNGDHPTVADHPTDHPTESPGRSVSTTTTTAATGPSTFKCATVVISLFITSVEHHQNTPVIFATVPLTETFLKAGFH